MPEIIGDEPSTTIDLVIRFDPRTNNVNVSGPIDNKVLAYGLLAIAQEIICDHHRKLAEGRRIEPVSFKLPGS